MIPSSLTRGAQLAITWADCLEDPVGDPTEAIVSVRTTTAFFWEIKEVEGVHVMVTTSTMDRDGSHQSGWTTYPLGMILDIEVTKAAPRRKKVSKKKGKVVEVEVLPGQMKLPFEGGVE